MNSQPIKAQVAQVCHGSSALELLSDQMFCQQWDNLYEACPWATATQTRAFAHIFYSVYHSIFEPVIVYARDAQERLSGLFALTVHVKSGDLVYVGGSHAEYQVWLATADTGNKFIKMALHQLGIQFPKAHLTLRYMPPGTPLAWLESCKNAYCKSVLRPLMAVGQDGNVEKSLRKKSNKSRISRLSKLLGELTLDVLQSRQAVEPIFERFAEFRDFRNAARYQSMPFQDDPLHREFTLRLVDMPAITHASVLRAGNEIIAANIGARDKSAVQVGNITLSPFVSEHSPGKLLLLFLGRKIAEEGFTDLDLTPCGGSADMGYKQRFADHFDHAYICYIALGGRLDGYLNKINGQLRDVRSWVADTVKPCLARADINSDTARWLVYTVKTNKPHTVLKRMLQWLLQRTYSDTQLDLWHIGADKLGQIGEDNRFHCNALKDLFLYEPATPDDDTKFAFLREAFARFETGGHVFTVALSKQLLHYAWIKPILGTLTTEIGGQIDVAKGSVLLWDNDYAKLSSRDPELYQASIRVRLREAVSLLKGGSIFISVPNDNESVRQIIERSGFHRYANVIRRYRWGKATWQWQFEHGNTK